MHITGFIPVLASAAAAASIGMVRRDAALRDSPSGNYGPTTGSCPSKGASIRQGSAIDPSEASYIQAKTVTSLGDWTSYLTSIGLTGLDVSTFVPASTTAVAGRTVPLVAFAVSGGGQRAMLVGGGILAAFDSRNATAVAAKSGGVLQLAQYLAGLSGGSWLTGSYALAGFPTFELLRDGLWDMTEDFFLPQSSDDTGYLDAAATIAQKADAGAPVSIVDAYGRLLSYHLVNDTRSPVDIASGPGAATLWSSIQSTVAFQNQVAPFPIILSTGRENGAINITIASPIYESTPYSFGTNLPTAGGLFVPIEYLGTTFDAGAPTDATKCVTGFENAGFLMGCSGNIFGDPLYYGEEQLNVSAITDNSYLQAALDAIPDQYVDDGRVPNPFLGLGVATGYPASADVELNLADGGLGDENIPFFPLLQPSRALDVIIAIDGSADANDYPDGTAIYSTYQKTLQAGYESTPFPVIPDPTSFLAQGLNTHPTFFGSSCYSKPNDVTTPLIVYIPNYDLVFATNTATTTATYSVQEQQSFFDNGFAIATQSLSSTWPACLACALVDAQVVRNGATRSVQCQACFTEYCYMGTA